MNRDLLRWMWEEAVQSTWLILQGVMLLALFSLVIFALSTAISPAEAQTANVNIDGVHLECTPSHISWAPSDLNLSVNCNTEIFINGFES